MPKLRFLSYIIMAYMILALGWWAILLYQQSHENYELKQELYLNNKSSDKTLDELRRDHDSQIFMIAGEAAVFMISLLLGLWFIQRGYKKQYETSEEKRNFLLSVTHELKSPISSIQLAIETLTKRRLNAAQQNLMLVNAASDTKRLDKLVNNLLLAANIESNYDPNYEKVDLEKLLLEIVDEIKEKFTKHTFNVNKLESRILIHADYQGARSIFYNLIENAAKYSPKGSFILVEVIDNNEKIEINIKDQGNGIVMEEREHVFDKFYRIGSEEIRQTKGTGLGLYIVKRMTQAHGWKVDIKNNLPQGAHFVVTIPHEQYV